MLWQFNPVDSTISFVLKLNNMLNLFSYKYLNGAGHHVAPLPSTPGV